MFHDYNLSFILISVVSELWCLQQDVSCEEFFQYNLNITWLKKPNIKILDLVKLVLTALPNYKNTMKHCTGQSVQVNTTTALLVNMMLLAGVCNVCCIHITISNANMNPGTKQQHCMDRQGWCSIYLHCWHKFQLETLKFLKEWLLHSSVHKLIIHTLINRLDFPHLYDTNCEKTV